MLDDSAHAVEDLEVELLLEGVFQRFGHDFRGYRREPLKRKLQGIMRASGLDTVSALQDRVMHDDLASELLLRMLSMRPATLFDDPDYFRALRSVAKPWLCSCPTPKVWIAECASAEEVFAVAILLAEECVGDKARIFATSANEILLHEAREGAFPSSRLAEYEENYRGSGGKRALSDYCHEIDGRVVFLPQMHRNITWAQYNLASDASFNEFELIVCRHAFGDFGSGLRRRASQVFDASLARFGILSIDGVDDNIQSSSVIAGYKPILSQHGLYQRTV